MNDIPEFDTALTWHVVAALLAFGVLLPVGASVALAHDRTGRSSTWFAAHATLQVTGAMIALLSVVAGFVHVSQASYRPHAELADDLRSRALGMHLNGWHHVGGALVFAGVVAEVIIGALRPPKATAGEPESAARSQWYSAHRAVAALVLLGGLAALLSGPDVLRDRFLGSAQSYRVGGVEYSVDITATCACSSR